MANRASPVQKDDEVETQLEVDGNLPSKVVHKIAIGTCSREVFNCHKRIVPFRQPHGAKPSGTEVSLIFQLLVAIDLAPFCQSSAFCLPQVL